MTLGIAVSFCCASSTLDAAKRAVGAADVDGDHTMSFAEFEPEFARNPEFQEAVFHAIEEAAPHLLPSYERSTSPIHYGFGVTGMDPSAAALPGSVDGSCDAPDYVFQPGAEPSRYAGILQVERFVFRHAGDTRPEWSPVPFIVSADINVERSNNPIHMELVSLPRHTLEREFIFDAEDEVKAKLSGAQGEQCALELNKAGSHHKSMVRLREFMFDHETASAQRRQIKLINAGIESDMAQLRASGWIILHSVHDWHAVLSNANLRMVAQKGKLKEQADDEVLAQRKADEAAWQEAWEQTFQHKSRRLLSSHDYEQAKAEHMAQYLGRSASKPLWQ